MRFLVLAMLATWSVSVGAQPVGGAVALLPLDADKRLEIYGQPVAREVGNALVQSGIEVVVVGAKMAVPERAQLIVDGTIKGNKGEVTLAVRLRDPRTGAVLDTLSASAKELTAIDHAAHELSALVVPAVQKTLAQLKAKPATPSEVRPAQPGDRPAAPPEPPVVLVAVTGATTDQVVLRDALTAEIATWTAHHHHAASPTDIAHLAREVAPKAVAGANAALAISFEVVGYALDSQGAIPFAYARVRVRIADRERVTFDRTVVTDSVVGDKQLAPQALAARAARAVLDIVEPHLRRVVPAWRVGG